MSKYPPSPAPEKASRIQKLNRQRILKAALDVFSQYGYRGSTIAQISERADMSKTNMLYYYKSKNDIYVAVLEETLVQWLAPLTNLNPDGDPATEIWQYVQTKLRLSKTQPEASKLFANEILQGAPMIKEYLQTDLKQLVAVKTATINQWIDQGKLVNVSALHLLFFIWASTQHYADFNAQTEILTDNPDSLFEDAERTLKTILLNGLLPRE